MRKRFLIIAIAVIAVFTIVLAFVINQELVRQHMYPQDAIHDSSNLSVRGVVTSIEENHVSQGMVIDSYHIFRFYIGLNITEMVWLKDDFADWDNSTVNGWNTVGIGYDNLDSPQIFVGQTIECKGYYASYTDTPYSFIITVSPSISESYLKPLIEKHAP